MSVHVDFRVIVSRSEDRKRTHTLTMGGTQSRSDPPDASPPEDADPKRAQWRKAFKSCTPTLEALALAQDEKGRLASRTWCPASAIAPALRTRTPFARAPATRAPALARWVVCMANQCGSCDEVYSEWK